MDVDGLGLTQLTNNSAEGNSDVDYQPSWSPDGSKIVFVSHRGSNVNIFVMDATDGANPTNLTQGWGSGNSPCWSPDGSKIAFDSLKAGNGYRDIYIMNSNGLGKIRLTTTLANDSANDLDPCWSPDGSKIAFTSMRDGNHEIYVMNADGTEQTNLTNNPGAIDNQPSWGLGSQIPQNYEFVTKWGSYGGGDGELNYPDVIAVDSSGNVYVADSYNHRIQKFRKQ
jgi:Tol biopolymer transport system component